MPPKFAHLQQQAEQPAVASHITTIGVKRPNVGTAGRKIEVTTNHFKCQVPQEIISHYDVIVPSETTLPARLNMEIVVALQTKVAPQIFTPRAVYDGRKNLFAARELAFGKTQEFEVSLSEAVVSAVPGKNPKVYKVRLTKVAEINPEVLHRFLAGQQSHDNTVLTAITALNVVVRMEPTIKYPFNVRSFFTDRETKDIGAGLILWRGYFQSVRPAIGRMLINIDISTGTMFKGGPLIDVALDFFNRKGKPELLMPKRSGFPDRERIKLQRFLAGVRVTTNLTGPGSSANQPRVLTGLTPHGAADCKFKDEKGVEKSVKDYFWQTYNKQLQFPDMICAIVGKKAIIPFELLNIPTGQIMRRQVPPEKTKDVLDFATKKPAERLQSIVNGLQVLAYGQSDYVRQFGLNVDTSGPLRLPARVLQPPTLTYGKGSNQPTIIPRDGSWNMVGKKFFQAAPIKGWVVIVYERQQRFNDGACNDMIDGMRASCKEVGVTGLEAPPYIKWENSQGVIGEQLKQAGIAHKAKFGFIPQLIVCVLPEGATDVYTAIKHFGDCTHGVATQCLKSSKCFRAKPQYYANVLLKINVKLGGINTIPAPQSVPFLTDKANPTLIMGADVVHPPPGAEGRPSFTSLVANVDKDNSKYIAKSMCQTSRNEIIEDLGAMVEYMLGMYSAYRQKVEKVAGNPYPNRIIFYRDGVSEGQFKTVLEQEVDKIKAACTKLGISPVPKITFIVVGKRHHVRFFPNAKDADRSGNCPAGTVVDSDVTHPLEFDFYLQSHGGLLGTSRPAHYNVLLDENNFKADGLQQLSFALCHVYARSTRSVSIPAPVYYADIVCARAKNHYDPTAAGLGLDSSADYDDGSTHKDSEKVKANLEAFRNAFKPLHAAISRTMYFS